MADRPGKAMAIDAVKKALAEEMQYEAPSAEARKNISERVAQKGREAEAEVKREMRGVMKAKGGTVRSSASKRADGIAQRGKTRGKIV